MTKPPEDWMPTRHPQTWDTLESERLVRFQQALPFAPGEGTTTMRTEESTMSNEKLYIVVREDLTPGLKIAQSAHALSSFEWKYPTVYKDWYETSNNLVVLQHADPEEIAKKLEGEDFRVARFYEPDLDNQLTAISVEPSARKKLSSLRLAGWTERVRVVEKQVEVQAPSLWQRLKLALAS